MSPLPANIDAPTRKKWRRMCRNGMTIQEISSASGWSVSVVYREVRSTIRSTVRAIARVKKRRKDKAAIRAEWSARERDAEHRLLIAARIRERRHLEEDR